MTRLLGGSGGDDWKVYFYVSPTAARWRRRTGWGTPSRLAASPASGRSHGCGSRTLVTSRTWTRRCGSNVVVDSALVDMFLKCSSPEDAHWVFAAVAARNITMWTTVMSGHSQHGRVAEALALFDQMMRVDRLRQNDVTFLTVLSACAHVELVDQGALHFQHEVVQVDSDTVRGPRQPQQ